MTSEPPRPPLVSPRLRGGLALVLALQIGLGLVVAQVYLAAHNSLHDNGNWSATKATLAESVMGAQAFLHSLQPLAGGHLNLAAWHGYQEVVLERDVDPVSILLDFRLAPGGYLTLALDRTAPRYTAIRVGRNRLFPSAVLVLSEEGRKLRMRRLRRLRPAAGRWHTLEIAIENDRLAVSVDGGRTRTFPTRVGGPQRIGLRGGHRAALVDNLRIRSRDGSVFRDTFDRPANHLRIRALAVGGVLLLAASLFLLLRRGFGLDDKRVLFYYLMFTVLLTLLGALAYGLAWRRQAFYPEQSRRLRAEEADWREQRAASLFADLERDSRRPDPDVHRILFVGSSQTRGAGATRADETIVHRVQELLDARAGGRRFECINAAVRSYRVVDMARALNEHWLAVGPQTVIVNASNNDVGTPRARFAERLTGLVESALASGARVVLIMEPNSLERRDYLPVLRRFHATMAEVGARLGVPVIDMHDYLARHWDDGFLWWDWVHLTSFGQRLFAEHLVDELERLGIVRLAPQAAPAPARSTAAGEPAP